MEESTPRGTEALELLPLAAALYAEDPSPEFGALDPVPSLSDGDTDFATDPRIDVGGGLLDRNIGVDLGFERPVRALYIATDRGSDPALGWRVYVSGDNLTWDLWDSSPVIRFHAGLQRFEILFEEARTRYVKAVNTVPNPVAEVLVTEVQALRRLEGDETTGRSQSAHLASLGAAWQITPAVASSFDASLQHEPAAGLVGRQTNLYYAVGGRVRQSEDLSHSVRVQGGFQDFEGEAGDIRNRAATYDLRYEPLQDLDLALSAHTRLSHLDGKPDQENNGVLLRASGSPLQRLRMTAEAGRSRNHQFLAGRRDDIWNLRGDLDGHLTGWLDLAGSYAFQRAKSRPERVERDRHQATVDLALQLTRSIYGRASAGVIQDRERSVVQDYLASWSLSPKLSLSGQVAITEAQDSRTERYGTNLNWDLTRSISLYASWQRIDFSRAAGGETTTFQQGFRMGF